MRKSEHMLRLSFDPEYQEKHLAWRNILQMYIEIEVEYLSTPSRYVIYLIAVVAICALGFGFVVFSDGRLWWLGIPVGVLVWFLISLGVTAHMLWEERRKLGLDMVWPW